MLKYEECSRRVSIAVPSSPDGAQSTINSYLSGNLADGLDSMCRRFTPCFCKIQEYHESEGNNKHAILTIKVFKPFLVIKT
jgi:hypothetical protein